MEYHDKRFLCIRWYAAGCDTLRFPFPWIGIEYGDLDQGCNYCRSTLLLAVRIPG